MAHVSMLFVTGGGPYVVQFAQLSSWGNDVIECTYICIIQWLPPSKVVAHMSLPPKPMDSILRGCTLLSTKGPVEICIPKRHAQLRRSVDPSIQVL